MESKVLTPMKTDVRNGENVEHDLQSLQRLITNT